MAKNFRHARPRGAPHSDGDPRVKFKRRRNPTSMSSSDNQQYRTANNRKDNHFPRNSLSIPIDQPCTEDTAEQQHMPKEPVSTIRPVISAERDVTQPLCHEYNGHDRFHDRITNGDRLVAVTTLTS